MENIKITKTGTYLPEIEIQNEQLEKQLNLEPGYIKKRTGITKRYYTNNTQEDLAEKLLKKMFKTPEETKDIDLIIAATTTPNYFMPGIANIVQKKLQIEKCISFDILAGCSGFINAIDIAQKYIKTSNIKKALIIGIEQLSKFVNKEDISTCILLSDGIGAVLLEKTNEPKTYYSNIQALQDTKQILTSKIETQKNELKLTMNGIEIYKYAVTETVKNIKQLLKQTNQNIEEIKYIIPHQSNLKIIKSIATRLGIKDMNKMCINIEKIGNTFCASIPIILDELYQNKQLKTGEKIILLGYGGGLNTGSILMEV